MMNANLITFSKFANIDEAYQLADLLKSHDIEYIMEDVPVTFDPGFRIPNPNSKEYLIKVMDTDFLRIQQILDKEASEAISNVESDYYLFDFTNDELVEVIAKRDEWNAFDVSLSRKILAERGREVSDHEITIFNAKRFEKLKEPEPPQRSWIIIGYLCSFLGGILGIFIGWHLWTNTKTLPNGEQIFDYNADDRKHGKRIFILSTIIFTLCFIGRLTGIIFEN